MPKARLDGWLLADQAWPVRLHCRGAKRSAAGMGWKADPLEGKRSAQASVDRREGTMEARKGRDAQRLDAKHDSAARHRREMHRTKFTAISGLLPTLSATLGCVDKCEIYISYFSELPSVALRLAIGQKLP